jgi:hypothetical protein
MQSVKCISVVAMFLGLTGCATSPVVLTPVGPNPAASADKLAAGQLEVFSALEQNDEK